MDVDVTQSEIGYDTEALGKNNSNTLLLSDLHRLDVTLLCGVRLAN